MAADERGWGMAGKDGCVLGIDVGGTSIKAGLMTVGGEILDMTKIPTGEIVSDAAYQEITNGLSTLVASAGYTGSDVVALGLDVPGPVDDQGRASKIGRASCRERV